MFVKSFVSVETGRAGVKLRWSPVKVVKSSRSRSRSSRMEMQVLLFTSFDFMRWSHVEVDIGDIKTYRNMRRLTGVV